MIVTIINNKIKDRRIHMTFYQELQLNQAGSKSLLKIVKQ